MRLTVHASIRWKQSDRYTDNILETVEKYWNNGLRYSIYTEAFYVFSDTRIFVIKDNKVITLYPRGDKLLYRASMPVPRHLKIKIKEYYFWKSEFTLDLFRECKKYFIDLHSHKQKQPNIWQKDT